MKKELIKDQPLITIIIPVYNAAQYLSHCLESIINQTYKNLEIICVNDASTDNSLEILNKFKDLDSRIIVINKKNEGVSLARNVALDIATGAFILFVDADDWIDLDTCEEAMKQIDDADVLIWSYIREYDNTSVPKNIFSKNYTFTKDQVKDKLHRRMIGIVDEELSHPENADALSTVWGKIYRHKAIEKIRFVDIREIGSYEDGLFNLYVFNNIRKARYVNEYYYHYRKTNAASITTKYKPLQAEQFRKLFRIMQRYINIEKLGDRYKKALNNRIIMSIMGLTLNIVSSNKTLVEKLKEEKELLSHPVYRKAFRNLSLSFFPLQWKLFYGCAKYNCYVLVYFLGVCIDYIIRHK